MKINQYFRELRQEMTHVTWPKKNTAIALTIVVIVISLLIAYFLGAFDKIFSFGLEKFLIK